MTRCALYSSTAEYLLDSCELYDRKKSVECWLENRSCRFAITFDHHWT